MSFFLRNSIRSAAVVARPAVRMGAVQQQRTFTNTSMRALKESDRLIPSTIADLPSSPPKTDSEDLADHNEKHKNDSLSKQKQGKAHWKPELASDSEEAVAADRHEHEDHSAEGIKELQKKTEKHAEEKHS
ncbi:hypothetical protein PVAG01_06114 [Phlyctema vagabunda]|uniref:Uncharacterized protein n=1 Tax=Phlyctema vagabunda TaxID=108571 RepID=A0ABR4PF97_9HELO